MNIYNACVSEFITKFDASKDPDLWVKLINEEADELIEASANMIKEYCDLMYVIQGCDIVSNMSGRDKEDILPPYLKTKLTRIINIMENLLGAYDDDMIDAAFLRVHASNMSKLGEDGKPIRRSDGKIQKGPNYKPANLLDLVY